jgi:hypothetical protein
LNRQDAKDAKKRQKELGVLGALAVRFRVFNPLLF